MGHFTQHQTGAKPPKTFFSNPVNTPTCFVGQQVIRNPCYDMGFHIPLPPDTFMGSSKGKTRESHEGPEESNPYFHLRLWAACKKTDCQIGLLTKKMQARRPMQELPREPLTRPFARTSRSPNARARRVRLVSPTLVSHQTCSKTGAPFRHKPSASPSPNNSQPL